MVASAIRHLGEREAAFTKAEIYRTALGFALPTTFANIERRVDQLIRQGHLEKGKGADRDLLGAVRVPVEARLADEEARRLEVLRLQSAAKNSLAWFEDVERYLDAGVDAFVAKPIVHEQLLDAVASLGGQSLSQVPSSSR